jgi:hypothetical protein
MVQESKKQGATRTGWLSAPSAAKKLILVALLISLPALSAALAPKAAPTGNMATVLITLTGKDANGRPFSTVRSLDIALPGTPDKVTLSATLNPAGAASSGKAEITFDSDGLAQSAVPATANAANTPNATVLPDFGTPSTGPGNLSVRPSASGLALESNLGRQKVVIAPEYSNQTGFSIGGALASMIGDEAAVGVLLSVGADKKEWLVNAGYKLDEHQRFIVTAGQLEQFLNYAFQSGTEKVGVTQNSIALSYQLQLGNEFLRFLEVNGYLAKTDSIKLSDKTFAVDTATLFELWNDPRRIAGGKVTGFQGKLHFAPFKGSVVKVSLGQERLSYDLQTGNDSVNRLTGGFEWLQQLGHGYLSKLAAESFASQNRYTLGIERSLPGSGGRHNLGVSAIGVRGRDGIGNDNQFQLTYRYDFGGSMPAGTGRPLELGQNQKTGTGRPLDLGQNQKTGIAAEQTPSWSGGSLLDQVALRPSFIPSHVVAKIDNTALPTRLIAVDKTALPAGSSINAATGDITTPLGIAVTGIAGVTRNGGAFSNSGQFGLNGNSLVTKPSLITQPAVGVVDTYVVTVNNAGGGTTLATVVVSHGSVKIDSITITAGIAADTTAPVTTAAPVISSAATETTAAITQTINEAGTGYYLVLPAAAAVPGVAAVKAGTAFAMSANTATTVSVTSLTASTAYKYYFVARDAANNDQAAVSTGLAITTTAAAAAPTASAVAISGTAQVGQVLTGTYTYADANNDPQGTSTFRWLRNGVAIAGATASTYTLVAADLGTAISFEVTPVATVAPTTGIPVVSTATALVTAFGTATAPTASTVIMVGTAQVGQILTGYYTYADANNDPQGASTFRWLRNGVAIAGASASTYTLVAADQGKAISFEVTPVAMVAPTTGTPVVTAATALVLGVGTPAAPTASALAIAGAPLLGEVLTGSYTYADANNDPEGASILLWMRDGYPIAGANATTYTVVAADVGSRISFKVTPVAITAPTTGTGVWLNTAIITGDIPTTLAPPTVSGVGYTSLTAHNQMNDSDGIRSVGYFLFSNAAATVLVGMNSTGNFSNLVAGTNYWVKTGAETRNGLTDVWSVQWSPLTATATDGGPPITTGAPQANNIAPTSATLSVKINIIGTGYHAVLPSTSSAPSVANLMATGTSFAMNAEEWTNVPLYGLVAGTSYSIYFVAKDRGDHPQAAVQRVDFTVPLLAWMPVTFFDTWTNANTYCTTTTINGQTGWRLPTTAELSALYTSGAMNGQGWTLSYTWSSTPHGAWYREYFDLNIGNVGWTEDVISFYVSCVRPISVP